MSTQEKTGPLELGDPPPSFVDVTWIKGKTPGFTRRFTVIELWATWCPPCQASIPHLSELQRAHPDELEIVGLTEEAISEAQPFVAQMGDSMAYTVGVAPTSLYSRILEGLDAIPHAFLFDDQRRLLWSGHPMQIDDTLDALLSGAQTGDTLIALDDFRRRIDRLELDPSDENRTEWTSRQNQRIDLYESILEIAPEDANSLEMAVTIAQALQDTSRVNTLLQRAKVERFSAPAACSLARALIDPDRGVPKFFKLALALVEHAYKLGPGEPAAEIVVMYANVCAFFGDFTSAIEALDRHLDRDPNAILVYANLRRIQERAALRDVLVTRRNNAGQS